ncbi:MAG: type IV pilus secretin PilQ [Myxococcaceae bacterium]|nr:type IV pilus secretin PilQ [Myxococcaceae bacterium]
MSRLLASAVLIAAGAAVAAPMNELKGLVVERSGATTLVRVEATDTPVFTVFRLQDPDRLVVDVSSARRGLLKSHYDGAGAVAGVVVSQFSEKSAEVARLLIGLDGAGSYDVRAEGTTLVVRVDGTAPLAKAPPPSTDGDAAEAKGGQAALPESAPVVAEAPQPRVDEVAVRNPGRRVTGLRLDRGVLTVRTDGEVRRLEVLELEAPPRLVFDLVGFAGPARVSAGRDALVSDVRVGSGEGRYRVVVEGTEPLEGTVKRVRGGLAIRLGRRTGAEVEIDGRPVAVAPVETSTEVKALTFKELGEAGVVDLSLAGSAKWKVERPDERTAALTLEGVRLPRSLERSLDTSDLGTVVTMVSSFSQQGDRVRVVVAGSGPIEEHVSARPGGLSWRLSPKGSAPAETSSSKDQTAGVSVEATHVAVEGAPQRTRYVGKKVSFEFKDIDIHNLLRIIADISKKNIVVADDVSGKVTIRLRNVPWDQALELVLRTKGLGQEDLGNIVRVAPLSRLEEESRQRAERRKNDRNTRELSVQLVPVNYATAGDMAGRVKDVLSERGNVAVDNRTNTLIVRDLPENMGRVRSLVASLDLQTPQVLIEARIVEVATRRTREIGIQWGGQAVMAQSTGNPTGLAFPNSFAATGAIPGGNAVGVSPIPNYAVSLPVGAQDGNGGAIGLVFGSAGSAATLNLRLSALESSGSLRTLSAPRVTTLNNQQARISQGTSIPFSQVSAAGANTVFVDSVLQLAVTPQITPDGSVLMAIQASNNQPDPANAGANGQPAISRKEAQTTVLVPDGDTTVIGGIYVVRGSTNTAGLPLLSKIPIIGFFFRNNRELEAKDELLFFITPRILNRQTMAQKL